MAQNDSVFAFISKTSNDSGGRPDLRFDINQVTNQKSLDFALKKVANLLGVSASF